MANRHNAQRNSMDKSYNVSACLQNKFPYFYYFNKEGDAMFLWDLVVDNVLEQFLDWIYGQVIGFLGEFLTMLNMMGSELFDLEWIKAIILFFTYLAWSLYVVGLVVAVFEAAIEMQNGRGSIRDVALNALKGFFAVSLFSVVPVELYKFCITLSGELIGAISGLTSSPESISMLGKTLIMGMANPVGSLIISLVFVILIGYSIIKVFFGNLKRGGILLTMIAVGSLYMFSVPRGYADGFTAWSRQVIALCLTAFLQTILLVAGLVTFNSNMLLGVGLMLSSTEVPRIAGNFGLETSTKANIMSTVYSAQSAVNLARTVSSAIAK